MTAGGNVTDDLEEDSPSVVKRGREEEDTLVSYVVFTLRGIGPYSCTYLPSQILRADSPEHQSINQSIKFGHSLQSIIKLILLNLHNKS